MGVTTFEPEEIEAAIVRAKNVYYSRGGEEIPETEWEEIVVAVLSAVYEEDYFDHHPDVRTFLAEDAEEVQWGGKDVVEVGEGAAACMARRGENPNWVLQHAANALALYRVLMGHEPWPTDPMAVERERMATALEQVEDISFTGTEHLAAQLQQLGFTLPARPAA